MKIGVEQLPGQLARRIAPVYLLAGDEPLQMQEAADAIRAAARQSGCRERTVIHADTGYDWASLTHASASLSLFAERRLIELRLPSGKPGQTGAKALTEYAARPAADTVLMIISGKLDKNSRNAKWVQALTAAGVFVPVWPVDPAALPRWIGRRMEALGLQPTPDAVGVLAERIEGNLLAAAQEIEKLRLLHGPGRVDADTVVDAVASSARFDVYDLADAALEGAGERVVRILDILRAEGIEPPVVLWALARDIRQLAMVARQQRTGTALDQLLARSGVWEKRRPLVKTALGRHRPGRWGEFLRRAANTDRVIKGASAGNAWDELLQLSLMIAGRPVIGRAAP